MSSEPRRPGAAHQARLHALAVVRAMDRNRELLADSIKALQEGKGLSSLYAAAANFPPAVAYTPWPGDASIADVAFDRSDAMMVVSKFIQDRMPSTFTSTGLTKAMAGKASKATVLRVLQRLVERGALRVGALGSGRRPTQYEKTEVKHRLSRHGQ